MNGPIDRGAKVSVGGGVHGMVLEKGGEQRMQRNNVIVAQVRNRQLRLMSGLQHTKDRIQIDQR